MSDPIFMASLHAGTPTVVVTDARGLAVRTLAFLRHPDTPELTPRVQLTRQRYSAAGLPLVAFGPRALADHRPDMTQIFTLGGLPLRTDSVDAGRALSLTDTAGRPLWACSAEGTVTTWQYEAPSLPGRLLAVSETPTQGETRVCERLVWGTEANKVVNLAGAVTHHYDNAGLEESRSASLTGAVTQSVRTLMRDEVVADWAAGTEAQWPAQLESETHVTGLLVDATGAPRVQTNAAGAVLNTVYDITGGIKRSTLTLSSDRELVVLAGATFTAASQLLTREHGNGVIESYDYDPQTRRLIRMTARRPAGHPSGAVLLQDLHYAYDPAGNVLTRRDDAVAVRYWRNQRVAAESTYGYDTLYRLTSASGRELAVTGSTPVVPLPDDGAWTQYSEQYSYDEGDNLAQIRHLSTAANNNWTRTLVVSDRSNRGLNREGLTPGDVEALFTPGGAQRELADGRALDWGADGQLARVTPVAREDGVDDTERYRYAGAGSRIRKLNTRSTGTTVRLDRVTYLPGLEWRETFSDAQRISQVAVTQTGSMRVIGDLTRGETVIRVSLADHLGSVGLEMDEDGALISREEYYPYGGTAGYARSEVEAVEKARRYSGKERDATGLYYYGYRYYQSDAGRWLSADPAGMVDGLNLYRMVGNNPITLIDPEGMASTKAVIEKQVSDEFILKKHMRAIEIASLQLNATISFRAAGAATLQALERGAAAKGHDILEKTIKKSSIERAYPENSTEVFQRIKDAGIMGYVGHWTSEGLKGIYMSGSYNSGEGQAPSNIYPIDMNDLDSSLAELKSMDNWQALPFTGDYDMHDMITSRGAGRPRTVMVNSKEEREIIEGINKNVSKVDSNRPLELIDHNVIRHGAQVNFSSFMISHEAGSVKKNGGFLGVVANPGEFPLAMVHKGNWSIINNTKELESFYDRIGAVIKETWRPDGQRKFKSSGNGMVTLSRR